MSAFARRLALTAGALALAGAGVPAAFAQPVLAPVPSEPTDADRDAWEQRIRDSRNALVEAKARREAAEFAYDDMRGRDYPRGEAKKRIIEERSAAREAEKTAQAELDATLDQARRAGVPPGWLRAPGAQADLPSAPAPAGSDEGAGW